MAFVALCAAAPALLLAQDTTRSARPDTSLVHSSRLNQVTITTTPVERSEPLTVIHLTPLTVLLTPANSPWELFRDAAGLEAHEQGQGPGFASDLSIRGFSSDHSTDMALYIDGVPNNEPVNGHAEGYNDVNLLMPPVVSGIDVVKGPTSALYGNFAFGGAVNVRTLNRFSGLDMSVGSGSFGLAQGDLITGFDHGSTGGIFAVSGYREDGWRPHSGNQYGHLHAAIVHDLSTRTTIDAGVDAYLTSYSSPGFLDTTLYNAGNTNFVSNYGDGGFKRHAQERVSLRTFLSPSLEWRSTIYSQQGTWQFWLSSPPGLGGLTEGTGAETREFDSRYGFGGTSALTYAAPGVDVTLGVDARYTHARYENYAESSTGFRVDSVPLVLALPATQTSGGLFVQSGVDVTKYARLSLGARLDQLSSGVTQPQVDASGDLLTNDLYSSQHAKGIFSPKTGLLIRPFAGIGHPGFGVFANVSRGFRQTDGVISDPTLPFITVWDYETGVKFDVDSWSVDASLFRMDVSNEQSFDPALNTAIGGGQSRRNGLDVSSNGRLATGVTADVNFTVLNGFYTHFVNPDDNYDYSHTPIFNTSKYVGSVLLDFNIPGQIWLAQVGANLEGPYTPFEEPGVTRPGYALFQLAGGVKLTERTQLLLGVRNLLDVQYRELESGGQVTPGEGRTVYLSMRYKRP
jgi:outer membrane receptor protein involved in Fe transport